MKYRRFVLRFAAVSCIIWEIICYICTAICFLNVFLLMQFIGSLAWLFGGGILIFLPIGILLHFENRGFWEIEKSFARLENQKDEPKNRHEQKLRQKLAIHDLRYEEFVSARYYLDRILKRRVRSDDEFDYYTAVLERLGGYNHASELAQEYKNTYAHLDVIAEAEELKDIYQEAEELLKNYSVSSDPDDFYRVELDLRLEGKWKAVRLADKLSMKNRALTAVLEAMEKLDSAKEMGLSPRKVKREKRILKRYHRIPGMKEKMKEYE